LGLHAAADSQSRAAMPEQAIATTAEAADERQVASLEQDSRSPRAVLLKAEMPGAEQAPQAQQWVVLTTWEQVTNTKAGVPAEYDTGADRTTSAEPASRTIVTRMILRVFPASSFFTQPAVAHVRSGWLVMQL
jgi:hypothetical protein